MEGVLAGFFDIAVVIALGALLAHIGLVGPAAQDVLARLAFFVAAPALMLVTVSTTQVDRLLSVDVIAIAASMAGAGLVSVLLSRYVWRRDLGASTIGVMSATYVNAGNLGIPVADYVLGNPAYIVPTLLFQLIVVQPICLALLDIDARGHFSVTATVLHPFKNPLTLAGFLGIVLATTGWRLPAMVQAPIELVGGMAIPSMLIAYGIALRLSPGLGREDPIAEVVSTSLIKLVLQPALAWFFASQVLDISGHALLVIVVASALPTAQNIFVHAVRFNRAPALARDTILLTTLGAAPLLVLVAWVLG